MKIYNQVPTKILNLLALNKKFTSLVFIYGVIGTLLEKEKKKAICVFFRNIFSRGPPFYIHSPITQHIY